MPEPLVDIALRPLTADDLPLVYDSWLGVAWDFWRHLTESCPSCGRRFTFVGKDAFHDGMHARVTRLLARGRSFGISKAGKEDCSYLLGYVVRDQLPVLHMLYVMKGWRKYGVAREVFTRTFPEWPAETVHYSQDTQAMPALRKKFDLRYNPFLTEV